MDELYSWTFSPLPDVLVKYFSSENFSSTFGIACAGFYALEDDDATRVAETVFGNPLFATNYEIALSAISYPSAKVENMGWNHLLDLSLSTDSEITENTYWICKDVCSEPDFSATSYKLYEIGMNILENPAYDFQDKYTYFCFLCLDEYMSNIAFERLLQIASTADEETEALIRQMLDELHEVFIILFYKIIY